MTESAGVLPRVTIHVITYNQLEFVEAALTSALDQDYDNLEVVVADDASKDGTQELIRDLASKYPGRLKPVLAEVNRGITGNSNAGLEHSTGDFIAFQGGDDILLPGKIRKQVEWFASRPQHRICYHDVEVFDSDSGRTMYLFSDRHPMQEGDANILVREGTFFAGTSVMVRRSCIPPGGFDRTIPVTSDWLFFVECLAGGGLVGPLRETLARYRRHGGNVTANREKSRAEEWQTLELIAARYPHLRESVAQRSSDFLLLDGIRELRAGHPGTAVRKVMQSLRLTGTSWNSGRLIAREAGFRLRAKLRGTELR